MPKDTEKTQKPREKPAPYARKKKPAAAVKNWKDVPKTSAKSIASSERENLTLADWLMMFQFMDEHPRPSQAQVVAYFSSKKDGALVFQQCTLSRSLSKREELKGRVNSHPNALSSKCARVVTRPDVERALVLWVHHMEEKGETVTGPMLREKRKRFEYLLNVPDNEHLSGDSWLMPFCRAYKIKEHKRHGEAGSVDLDVLMSAVVTPLSSLHSWNS